MEKKIEEQNRVLTAEKLRNELQKGNTKEKMWAKVNDRATKANQKADVEAYKTELNSKLPEKRITARRRNKPRILWDVGQVKKEDEKDDTIETGDKTNDDNEAEAALQDENDESGNPNISSRDLRNSLKLNEMSIDEEAIPRLMGSNSKKPVTRRVRKGISLSEYLERKAAGTL